MGFWLSPLKQRVYDYLYPTRILIKSEPVCLRTPLWRGDTFIIKLHVISETSKLFPGAIQAQVPTDYLQLEDGSTFVKLDGSEKGQIFTYRFDALKAGNPHLTYVYSFANGRKLTEDVPLTIVDRTNPTFEDLSGIWDLAWQNSVGELRITQQNHRLTGTFSLSEIEGKSSTGTLTGFTLGDNIELVF